MAPLAWRLRRAGLRAVNLGYPSRRHPIDTLAAGVVSQLREREWLAPGGSPAALHFVTHSMGGIVLRALAHADAAGPTPAIGRVVMLAPPNRGSELVDYLRHFPPFRWLNGPAGLQLGTDSASVPLALGPVDFELGVIAGRRSLNPLFSRVFSGANDGKVAVEGAGVEGMKELLVVDQDHTFMPARAAVAHQVLHFLRHGEFRRAGIS